MKKILNYQKNISSVPALIYTSSGNINDIYYLDQIADLINYELPNKNGVDKIEYNIKKQ